MSLWPGSHDERTGRMERMRIFKVIAMCCVCFSCSQSSVFGQLKTRGNDDDQRPVESVLFGSCIKQERPIPILHTILSRKPDVFIFLGDNIYADTEDMGVMSTKYSLLKAHREFQQLMKSTQVLATWDDHDYGVNDGGADYPRRVESQKLFLDFWNEPVESVRRKTPGIYDARVYGPEGKRLQIILLDTRYFRSPLKRGPKRVGGSWQPDRTVGKQMLGEAQWAWLETELRKPAEVRIIASSIQCVAQDAGQESWANLPLERTRLFNLIKSTKANGCLLISGDRHWSELSMTDEDTPYPMYDLTSSSFNQKHARGTPTENRFRISKTTWHQENFGVIGIDWNSPNPSVRMEIRDIENGLRLEKSVRLSELAI